MEFSWRPDKAKSNVKKHRVSFTEATTVFADPYAENVSDRHHHERSVITGYSSEEHLLIVVHIEIIEEDWVRIISARKANPKERKRHAKWLASLGVGEQDV